MPARPDNASPFRLDFPPELPISARAEEIVEAIQRHPVLILAGETGSGKTTQLPKLCLAAGRGQLGRIACTQPRRVAALSVSRRVAEELRVDWGREVGCKIRFNDQTSAATIIKFLTDGMLLAEVQGDPLLREYDTVIIDEAHERSLNIDFLIGHLRTLRARRPDLKIILTSATIDTDLFSAAFDDAPVISVSGRTYPVEVVYSPLDALGSDYAEGDENEDRSDPAAIESARAEALHYIDGAVEAVLRLCDQSRSGGGDILVFMPSERDIRETCELLDGLRNRPALRGAVLIPLFGRLSAGEQQRVFAPSQSRKIIVATNIAETSLTLPGIRFVVDTGLARLSRYSAQTRTRRLPIEPISQSSADQRKGRSGRVAEGLCIRLYSEKDFLERPRFTQPEIQRANLADVILRMLASGLGDIESFPFINRPSTKAIKAGYALLEELGAIERKGFSPAGSDSQKSGTFPRAEERGEAQAQGPTSSCEKNGSAPTSRLTPLGRELARLPVDPTIGRMILQARREHALGEVLVIAAALSIQDPRERPLDKQAQADAAHRRFLHPDSDFLTLLNIWGAYHDEFEALSQSRLRKFCREHFLSYPRMREWRDIHAQLREAISEGKRGAGKRSAPQPVTAREQKGDPARKTNGAAPVAAANDPQTTRWGTPAYRAIHRAILAGLLGNIAEWQPQDRYYKAQRDRRLALFPGSVLYQREARKAKERFADGRATPLREKKGSASPWIMAGEVVETSRLYARTCARIDPQWAVELGAHLIKFSYSEPFWDEAKGRVMVKQRARLHGLELQTRAVSFGRVEPRAATEIFIREGLVNDTITWPFDFLAHNRRIRAELEERFTRTRDSRYLNLDEALYRFYEAQLLDEAQPHFVSAVAELVDLVRERAGAQPDFLKLRAEDLLPPEDESAESGAAIFPESLPLQNSVLALNYAYRPGQADDGVTLDLTPRELDSLSEAALDWAIPGHLSEKVEFYLRGLPKELRRALVPLSETAKSLATQVAARARLTAQRETLTAALAAQLNERFGLHLSPSIWEGRGGRALPEHLRVRVRVIDEAGRELCASRELAELRAKLAQAQGEAAARAGSHAVNQAWARARARWEKLDQADWAFGDIPSEVQIGEDSGLPLMAYPGLCLASDGTRVSLKLFRTRAEAERVSRVGIAALLELQLRHDLGWLARDLRDLRKLGPLVSTLAPLAALEEDAAAMLRRWVCDPARVLSGEHKNAAQGNASGGSGGLEARVSSASRGGDDAARAGKAGALSAANFAAALAQAKAELRGIVPRLCDLLGEVLRLRQELLVHPTPYAGLSADLAHLLPPDFMRRVTWPQLAQFPRYLRGLRLRADRWRQNPQKDAERARQLAPYLRALAELSVPQDVPPDARGGRGAKEAVAPFTSVSVGAAKASASAASVARAEAVDRLRWLVEELRVSLFAQELGTAEPVSPKKLDELIAALRLGKTPETAASPAPAKRPIHQAPTLQKQPLKTLAALDKLFRR
ncbi:DUF3418 domain-containing protein [Cephaloticoccus primus]|uniref:DUF3418 domain-containing protein n=1 Tax=Cephaloticoccus primus TaxID=1548207 RepID=UPI000A4DDB3D|nr:DUF3418 domain-containing protein [Cephaloticoccus primus]